MKGNPRYPDGTSVQSSTTSSHCCQDFILDVSRLYNWRHLEWNLLRRSGAIPSFSRPKTTTVRLTEPEGEYDRGCELCREISNNSEPAKRPRRPRRAVVELDYEKSVRLSCISIRSPGTNCIAKQFHVYALEGAVPNSNHSGQD